MAKQGFFRPEHCTIGKSTNSRGFLFAHANYICRPASLPSFLSIGFSSERDDFLSEISRYQHWAYGSTDGKANLRANARLADTFKLSLLRGMQPEHAREALHLFMQNLSDDGRANIFCAIHSNVPDNPHAHVLFVDRDTVTGKAVAMLAASPRDRAKAGFTTANATEYVRELWADAQNAVLAAYNYDLRVDHRSAERQAAELEHVSTDLPTAPDCHDLPPVQPMPESVEHDVLEDDMRLTGPEIIHEALRWDNELDIITSVKAERTTLNNELAGLKASLQQHEAKRDELIDQSNQVSGRLRAAEAAYANLTAGLFGRGLRLAAFGLEWKSGKRLMAESMEAEIARLASTASSLSSALADYRSMIELQRSAIASKQLDIMEAEHRTANRLQIEGTDKELDAAEADIRTMRQKTINWANEYDVIEYLHQGQITPAEASRALQLMGQHDLAKHVLNSIDNDKQGMAY